MVIEIFHRAIRKPTHTPDKSGARKSTARVLHHDRQAISFGTDDGRPGGRCGLCLDRVERRQFRSRACCRLGGQCGAPRIDLVLARKPTTDPTATIIGQLGLESCRDVLPWLAARGPRWTAKRLRCSIAQPRRSTCRTPKASDGEGHPWRAISQDQNPARNAA